MRLIITCNLLLSFLIPYGVCEDKSYDKIDIIISNINETRIDTLFNNTYVPFAFYKQFVDSEKISTTSLKIKMDSISFSMSNVLKELKSAQYISLSRFRKLCIVNLILLSLIIVTNLAVLIYLKKKNNSDPNNRKNESYDKPSKQIDINSRESEEAIKDQEIDHSLAVCAGTEIYRMRKRIENMDEKTTGLNALSNALTRLEDELKQQGYTINDITGQNFSDELTVKILNSIASEDIMPGKAIISKMIKPQIAYKGIVISHGEAEIAISPLDK